MKHTLCHTFKTVITQALLMIHFLFHKLIHRRTACISPKTSAPEPKYADLNKGKYRSTVRKWMDKAKKEWIDKNTGLLVSFVDEDGKQYEDAPVKGSYSALNCYYLTMIDKAFAKEQYETLKTLFWKDGTISGLKEYWDRSCPIGLDMDAGPIILELSPSGTAFFAGSSTFFNDSVIRSDILRTAEIAGHTIKWGNERHYLLANIALVGEAIMLAMRTANHWH